MDALFPYSSLRPHQDDLLEDVTAALKREGSLVAHAPTGLGKTAAVLSPALHYALNHDKTVFFLTPRHSQHEIAIETLQEIRDTHNTDFVVADLIGKRWLCEGAVTGAILEEDENACPRHDQTYDQKHQLTERARRKLHELRGEILRAEEVKARCDKVCPYEILMHMAAQADVVVGDYFHIFHPGVRDVIFSKSSLKLKDCIVIVDEAHNLADRTRRLNSATLTAPMIQDGIKEAKRHNRYDQEELLQRLQRELERLGKHELGMENEIEIEKTTLVDRVETLTDYDDLLEDLFSVANDVHEEGKESVCDEIVQFFEKWRGKDRGFVRVLSKVQYGERDPYLKISYTCLDPQYVTAEALNTSHASVLMSGTLKPLDMYENILGLNEEKTEKVAYESPFPKENRLNLVVDKVTTKYKARTDAEYQKIAWYLLKGMNAVDGNVGVFFPSYRMRDEITEIMKERAEKQLFVEDRRMGKEEKNNFLKRFAKQSTEGAALLGVIGGSFGEGVDFPGQLMSAVFIVGVPLQRPNLETQALIDFYDELFGKGWDYGYMYPAMNRAMQAAGRCIRSEDDRGVVMYLDERYTWSKYRNVFPDGEQVYITQAPWQEIEKFFAE